MGVIVWKSTVWKMTLAAHLIGFKAHMLFAAMVMSVTATAQNWQVELPQNSAVNCYAAIQRVTLWQFYLLIKFWLKWVRGFAFAPLQVLCPDGRSCRQKEENEKEVDIDLSRFPPFDVGGFGKVISSSRTCFPDADGAGKTAWQRPCQGCDWHRSYRIP